MLRNLRLLIIACVAVLVLTVQTALLGTDGEITGPSKSIRGTAILSGEHPADDFGRAAYCYIPNVPDWNQAGPPRDSAYCAPVSALNIVEYWNGMFLIWGLVDPGDAAFYPNGGSNTADHIAYFMGTNGMGSLARINTGSPGTFYADQDTGLAEYIAWDTAAQFHPGDYMPPNWKVRCHSNVKRYDKLTFTADSMWQIYKAEIDNSHPVKVDFNYWNPIYSGNFYTNPWAVQPDTFYIYDWGSSTSSSGPGNPPEVWTEEIGHAVTGVGYMFDHAGNNWAIVHDNWPTTAKNVMILWDHLMAVITVSRPQVQFAYSNINQMVPIIPYRDHCVATTYVGLSPPGGMGIWAPSHGAFTFFPSDPVGEPGYPQAWLAPGTYPATLYGPATVNIPDNPIVTVPDRNSNPCTLYVEIPPEEDIDQATDLNAIKIDQGAVIVIPIGDMVETLVFVANCDGDAFSSPDQSLDVTIQYEDMSSDIVTVDDIHPAGRGYIDNPGEIIFYDNEIFVCNPGYFEDPSPYIDPYHSEAWHWYAIYPDNTQLLDNITLEASQKDRESGIYIFGISYSKVEEGDEEEKGLVGHWRFEEGSGDTAYDETDYHHDGTVRGASWVENDNCESDSALEFHGGGQWFDGDRVLVPHSSRLALDGEITVAAWIKATGSDTYLAIVDKYLMHDDINDGFTLLLSNGRLRFSIYSGASGYCSGDVGTSDLRDGIWHHVAGVWDGSYVRGYIDGFQEGEVAYSSPPASTTNPLGIGERISGWGGYMPFLGVIDDVRVYNRALTSHEIGSLVCDCLPGDANNDCDINVADAVYLINYVFKDGPGPIPYAFCSGDANCDCGVNVADAVYIINYVFKDGPAPCDCVSWLLFCGQPLRN